MLRYALALLALSLLACNACNDGNAPPANTSGPPMPGSSAPSAPPAQAGAVSSAPPGSAPSSGAPTGETIVHVEDDGKSFDVARGATVTFKLAGNAGTGYAWTPTQLDANVLAQQGDRTSETSDVPGGAKMDVYHFAATSPGATAVEMSLKRAFGTAPPARLLHVTIHVR